MSVLTRHAAIPPVSRKETPQEEEDRLIQKMTAVYEQEGTLDGYRPQIDRILGEGYLRTLKYCCEHGYLLSKQQEWFYDLMIFAAQNSKKTKDILVYCHENGCHLDDDLLYHAMNAGNWDAAQYCLQHGNTWDLPRVMNVVVFGIRVDTLRFLYENHCPLYPELTNQIVSLHTVSLLEYWYKIRAPYGNVNEDAIPPECRDFLQTYGPAWKSGSFDVPIE